MSGKVTEFIERHYRHFNAATLVDAARGWRELLDSGGRMFFTMAGAMSTAELGLSLAEMIRRGHIHGICCTGANLEEDLYNLVAHDHYRRIPNWRDLTPEHEQALLDEHLNRVTDTCIPEEEAFRRLEHVILDEWQNAEAEGRRHFPHEFLYRIIRSGKLAAEYQIDPADSWLVAACEKNLPMFVPGWEDSTTGNIFASHCLRGSVKNVHVVRTGIEYMMELANWYTATTPASPLGFFQIGGGIAGDFPICVVPMLHQDFGMPRMCRSGPTSARSATRRRATAPIPARFRMRKITWGKLGIDTPKYIIESDASIVAPLVFAHVLGW
jgi:deoxyhypusine synthase